MDESVEALPAAEDIKKRPSKDEFDRKMRELDSDAVKMRGQVDHNRTERKSVYDGGKDG